MNATGTTPRRVSPPQPVSTYWIDVRDHMPDDEMTVLVADRFGDITLAWHADGEWREYASAGLLERITHWADLPEPPKNP